MNLASTAHDPPEDVFDEDTERPTLPPPPLYPSMLEGLREQGEPLSRDSQTLLVECAEESEALATALLHGAITREDATRLARAQLEGLELAARARDEHALGCAFAGVRALIHALSESLPHRRRRRGPSSTGRC